jgi:uncharacterized protein (DUF1330 family)
MIYAYVHMNISNPESLAAYREKAGAALDKHGGIPVAISRAPQSLEGPLKTPDVSVILTFPDKTHALAWINDPDLAEVHDLRRGAGESSVLLLG